MFDCQTVFEEINLSAKNELSLNCFTILVESYLLSLAKEVILWLKKEF